MFACVSFHLRRKVEGEKSKNKCQLVACIKNLTEFNHIKYVNSYFIRVTSPPISSISTKWGMMHAEDVFPFSGNMFCMDKIISFFLHSIQFSPISALLHKFEKCTDISSVLSHYSSSTRMFYWLHKTIESWHLDQWEPGEQNYGHKLDGNFYQI